MEVMVVQIGKWWFIKKPRGDALEPETYLQRNSITGVITNFDTNQSTAFTRVTEAGAVELAESFDLVVINKQLKVIAKF